MSKSSVMSSTLVLVNRLAEGELALASVDQLIASLKLKQNAKQIASQAKLLRKINKLPAMFGVTTIEEVEKLIQRSKIPVIPVDFVSHRGQAIPASVKAAVIAATENGMTAKDIKATLKISIPSIQNIKRDAGLVKERVKAAA